MGSKVPDQEGGWMGWILILLLALFVVPIRGRGSDTTAARSATRRVTACSGMQCAFLWPTG